MLRPRQYAQLYGALRSRNLRLVNSPTEYEFAHHFPNSYATIAAHTPRSVWLPVGRDLAVDEIMRLLAPFGAAPVIVKDYVKS